MVSTLAEPFTSKPAVCAHPTDIYYTWAIFQAPISRLTSLPYLIFTKIRGCFVLVPILQMTKPRPSHLLKFTELVSGQAGFGLWSVLHQSPNSLPYLSRQFLCFSTTFSPHVCRYMGLDLLLKNIHSWAVVRVIKTGFIQNYCRRGKRGQDRMNSTLNTAWVSGNL